MIIEKQIFSYTGDSLYKGELLIAEAIYKWKENNKPHLICEHTDRKIEENGLTGLPDIVIMITYWYTKNKE